MFVFIYLFIYMVTPPMNYRSSFCIVNRVKPAFPAGPDSVSLEDCQNQIHISRECARQLVQIRREHALNGNTVLFQSKTSRQATRLGST